MYTALGITGKGLLEKKTSLGNKEYNVAIKKQRERSFYTARETVPVKIGW